jgi:hypothetical protein
MKDLAITAPLWWWVALSVELGHPGELTREEIILAETEET